MSIALFSFCNLGVTSVLLLKIQVSVTSHIEASTGSSSEASKDKK